MCNIAGYVGTERAAPILLDLIRRQEGLAGGFYSGIATVHEGKLHWRKVVGDTARLCEETDAEELPGTTGIAHTRSNGGGDRNWAHPFVSCDGKLAYIANGGMGYFEDKTDLGDEGRRLEGIGHCFTAVADTQIGTYPSLGDGRCVHMSDVMVHAIEARMTKGVSPITAMEQAFLDIPAGIVGLLLSVEQPDSIFAAKYTMPMCVAIDSVGARIASSPTGFGGQPGWWTWVPPFSTAAIGISRLDVGPLTCSEGPLPVDISLSEARSVIVDALRKEKGMPLVALANRIGALSKQGKLMANYDPTYEALFELINEGIVEQSTHRVPGALKDLTAPQFRFALT